MTHALIFDMDGTLFRTDLILEPALERTFTSLRQQNLWDGPTPIDTYRDIMGVPLPIVWQTLCSEHPPEVHEESNAYFQQALIELIEEGSGQLYDDVLPTLAVLSETYPIYIASNGQTAYLQAIVNHYELDRYVKQTYSIDLIASGNKTELARRVLDDHHHTVGFVIGDRSSDIRAAKDNELTAVGVRFDFAQEEELAMADVVIDQFGELPEVLEKFREKQKTSR
ncbi:HAD family hydrolase [Chryseomicrobium palamuruense]|uniref:HAD family hydrolase n=1 Tax=Chryseomicrobium palamuruense TaxID=682973 RepID=A0ABV8UVQ5_9BACL